MNDGELGPATLRVARAMALLTAIGLAIDSIFWKAALGMVLWGHLAAIALSASLVAAVERVPRREWVGTTALFLNNTVALAALWQSDQILAHSDVRWTPFDVQRLGVLTIALFAPPRAATGVATIGLGVAFPLVEYATWDDAVRAHLPVTAPWAMGAYGVFACFLYAHLLRRRTMNRRAALAKAQAEGLERFARLVLAVRDSANTPLQTIELTVALLRRDGAEPRLLDRLARSVARLTAIGRALEMLQADGERAIDEASKVAWVGVPATHDGAR